jgi:transcriptional regulator
MKIPEKYVITKGSNLKEIVSDVDENSKGLKLMHMSQEIFFFIFKRTCHPQKKKKYLGYFTMGLY